MHTFVYHQNCKSCDQYIEKIKKEGIEMIDLNKIKRKEIEEIEEDILPLAHQSHNKLINLNKIA